MAKVTLGGTINMQGTKKISRTNLAHLREPAITTRLIVAGLKNSCLKTKMKHIDVRQTWVRTIRDASIAVPRHIKSEDNLADIFTKILLKIAFTRIRDKLMWSTINH